MSPPLASLAVSVAVFAGALVGLYLHRMLPEVHLTKDTQDVVRLGTGMLSVLASLVLALLISTAKTTYDTTDKNLRTFSAELILLNETLRDYGGDAAIPRDLLRRYTARMINETWPTGDRAVVVDDMASGTMLERVREAIRALKPVNAGQRWLQDQALQVHLSLLRQPGSSFSRRGRACGLSCWSSWSRGSASSSLALGSMRRRTARSWPPSWSAPWPSAGRCSWFSRWTARSAG